MRYHFIFYIAFFLICCSKEEYVPFSIGEYKEETDAARFTTTFYNPVDSMMKVHIAGEITPLKDYEYFRIAVGNNLYMTADSIKLSIKGQSIHHTLTYANAYNDPNDEYVDHVRRNAIVTIDTKDMPIDTTMHFDMYYTAEMRFTKRGVQTFNDFLYFDSRRKIEEQRFGWNEVGRKYFFISPL